MANTTNQKTSVKSYCQGVEKEKQKMEIGTKVFQTNVRSLQNKFKQHAKDMGEAASKLLEEGNRKMKGKISRFKGQIREQIKENNEANSLFSSGLNKFNSDINKKKKEFEAYTKGPFQDSIKAFWG